MRRLPRFGSILVASLVVISVSACGSATSSSAPAPATDGSIAVTLSEWTVVPAQVNAPAGSITFAVANKGTQIHEFVVVKTDLKAETLPVVDNKIDESTLTPVDEIEDIAVGATPTLTVDLAAGHYVLLCNIESHFEQGMRVDFDVN